QQDQDAAQNQHPKESPERSSAPEASYDVDITDADRLAAVAAHIQRTFGRVDALVTSAGAVQRGDLLTTAQSDLVSQVEVNLQQDQDAAQNQHPKESPERSSAPEASYDVDITDADRLAAVAAHIQRTFGRVDALVTSAGAVQRGDLLTTAQSDLVSQVEVNLL